MTNTIFATLTFVLVTNWTDLHVDVPRDPNHLSTSVSGVSLRTLLAWDDRPTRVQAGLVSSNVVAIIPWNGGSISHIIESTRLPIVLNRTIRSHDPQAKIDDYSSIDELLKIPSLTNSIPK